MTDQLNARPAKRARTAADSESEQRVKRPVGRPRRHPLEESFSVEFGSFTVSGIPRSQSLPALDSRPKASAATRKVPLAPIFARKSGPPLPLHASQPTRLEPVQASTSSIYGRLPEVLLPSESCERVISEEHYSDHNNAEPDDEADGSGEGRGDESDTEGDEEDPAELNTGDDLDESAHSGESSSSQREQDATKSKRHRTPLPEWLQSAFNARIEQCKDRNSEGQPRLYWQHKTFWFPNQSSWFILKNSLPSPQRLFNPRFFLWDPLCLTKVPCPNCKHELRRHGYIERPRRCVSFASTFWIIGLRYKCPRCIKAKTKGQNVTFRSWDSRILASIPPDLAAEFPAKLSHRSGIDLDTFEFMRSMFQNGLGSSQFSDALRVQHRLRHHKLELQYLQHLSSRVSALEAWRGPRYESFPEFDDTSPKGPHGYIPCGEWLRDMYDSYIEAFSSSFDQHMALLSAEVCAIDHSHKYTKYIIQLNGERVFTALLTVTNQLSQIRSCCLVATKSHSQFEMALQELSQSLTLYGLKQPILFYTDFMADRQFLMRVFPSLSADTIPVEKYQHLPIFTIPSNVYPRVFNTRGTINSAMEAILGDLEDDGENILVVGFDSEWNVQTGPNDRVIGRSPTAIIQIAYSTQVYILQVAEMVRGGSLPQKLKTLLSNPRVLKVGRLIESDIKILELACSPDTPFQGIIDLARYAVDRHIITSSQSIGLNDLCARVLGKSLRKNVPERVGEGWEREALTEAQIEYAASDAYVALAIYNRISTIPIPTPIQAAAPLPSIGTPVLLFNNGKSVIARAKIIRQPTENIFDGLTLDSAHIAIEVDHVVVPGALVHSHRKQSLKSFGTTPFSLVALRRNLRVYQPLFPPLPSDLPLDLLHRSEAPLLQTALRTTVGVQHLPSTAGSESSSTVNIPGSSTIIQSHDQSDPPLPEIENLPESMSIAPLVFDTVDLPAGLASQQRMDNSDVDEGSKLEGLEILGPVQTEWKTGILSRVLKDPFHIFNMFYISATHGLRVDFSQALRDAMFIPDPEDAERINVWGRTQNPPGNIQRAAEIQGKMALGTLQVFQTWGPLKDAESGAPLFNKAAWKTAKQILDLIADGFVSDPPGVALYSLMGIGKDTGLPIYRCFRGTNATEGGVHTHLSSHLPSSGTSIRHALACLKDFVLRRNLIVGTKNTTGKPYTSHFSIWVTNEIQKYQIALRDRLANPSTELDGWINTDFYEPTKEVIGVLPIPMEVQRVNGLSKYIESLQDEQVRHPIKHQFLARLQGTRKAVLPVHTQAERKLFQELIQKNVDFEPTKSGIPNWDRAVRVWNQLADTTDGIYYKLIEQLRSYHTSWRAKVNVKTTLSMTHSERGPVRAALIHPARAANAPPLQHRQLQRHTVSQGFIELDASEQDLATGVLATIDHDTSARAPEVVPASAAIAPPSLGEIIDPFTTDIGSLSHSQSGNGTSANDATLPEAAQRVTIALSRGHIQQAMEAQVTEKAPRKPRACMKCGLLGAVADEMLISANGYVGTVVN